MGMGLPDPVCSIQVRRALCRGPGQRRAFPDVNLLWPADFRWYAEFFLDDMLAPWKIFSSDFGNKWALTVGGQYFGTLFDVIWK